MPPTHNHISTLENLEIKMNENERRRNKEEEKTTGKQEREKKQEKKGGKHGEKRVLGESNLGLSAWKTTTLTTTP